MMKLSKTEIKKNYEVLVALTDYDKALKGLANDGCDVSRIDTRAGNHLKLARLYMALTDDQYNRVVMVLTNEIDGFFDIFKL